MSRALHHGGKSPFGSARRSRSKVPASLPLPNAARPSLLRRKAGHCACGGACPRCQTAPPSNLTIGAPDDRYEREADAVAERVMRRADDGMAPVTSAASALQRQCAECEKDGDESLLRPTAESSAASAHGTPVPSSVPDALKATGLPLAAETRAYFEPRFGRDFSGVRVHADALAAQSAQAVQAQAYTVGQDIVFGSGQYSPHTAAGRRLLAHELVHTLQQGTPAGSPGVVRRQTSLDIALRSPTVAAQVLGAETLDGFALNGHALTGEHKRRLLALADRLRRLLGEHPRGTVEITGHTDATGGEALNDRLGRDRADTVAAFLIRSGISVPALQVESAGESALRVPTERAEPRNRRVEIRFLPELPSPSPQADQPGTDLSSDTPVRIPRPETLCTEHPEICEPITTKPEAMPSCSSDNCSAISGHSFDKQPPDFRRVLTKSFKSDAAPWFEQLDGERRMALTQIFNRLCRYRLWCKVRLVLKVDAGEAPVLLADRIFDVPGRTPSAYFTSPSGDDLISALMATGRFCTAYGTGASQHPGQTTLREISGSDSLHVSVGPGDQFDAHIDKYSPVPEHPGSSFCSNAPSPAAVGHIGREVVSEKTREKTGIPGFQVFPEPPPAAPVPEGAVGPEPYRSSPGFSLGGITGLLIGALLESSRVTARGPRRARPQPLVPPEVKRIDPALGILPPDVVAGIRHALEEQVSPEALLPSRVRVRRTEARKAAEQAGPDEEAALRALRDAAEEQAAFFTDAHDLAFDLAVLMERARRGGRAWVKIELDRYGHYGGLDGASRKALIGEIRRIALILRHHLPNRAAGVNTLVIIFGQDHLAVREEIRLPGWVTPKTGIFY